MKITRRILSIPPLLTTTWSNVESVRVDEMGRLWVALYDGNSVCIPDIDQTHIDRIFRTYEMVLELEEKQESEREQLENAQGMHDPASGPAPNGFRLNFGIIGSLEDGLKSMGSLLQHDYQNSQAPTLPAHILDQVSQMAKALGPDHIQQIPKPEPHCNCPHCQIVRTIRGQTDEEEELAVLKQEQQEEPISEQDLTFRDWEVREDGDRIFTITNPLDPSEQYKVCLREPVGCTCGGPHCEHISAALRS